MAIEAKQGADKWLKVVLIDDTDFKSPETGVAFGSVTCYYTKEGDAGSTQLTLNADNWKEKGYGRYRVLFPGTVLDTLGGFDFIVQGSGYLPWFGEAEVVANTNDDLAARIDAIASSGAQINTPATDGSTVTTGQTVAGTYANTASLDGSYWQIDDNATGTIDMYFEFAITADSKPVSFTHVGRCVNDDLAVYAYNWGGSTWEQIGSYPGKVQSTDDVRNFILYEHHAGTGANLGKVRVRFYGTGLSAPDLYTDQCYLSYSVVSRTVGYADGAIWVDTLNGTSGLTEVGINGTADNPVGTWADALTLSGTTNLKRFRIAAGSSVTLTGNSDGFAIIGAEYSLAFGGQSIAGAYIEGATVTGTSAGASARFIDCKIGTCSLTACGFGRCAIQGDVTLLSASTYIWEGCFTALSGAALPTIDFGAALGDTHLNLRHWSGPFIVANFGASGADGMCLEGDGAITLAASCAGGSIAISGAITVTDNAGGAVTLTDDARLTRPDIATDVRSGVTSDHGSGSYVNTPLTGDQDTKLTEVWQRIGLDVSNPLVNTPEATKVPADGSIINIVDAVSGDTVTSTRQ